MHKRRVATLWLLLVLLLVLTACQTRSHDTAVVMPLAGIDQTNPLAVHEAWITALTRSDRVLATSLLAHRGETWQRDFAARQVRETAWLISEEGQRSVHGTFQAVEVRGLREDGGAIKAYSYWQHERSSVCRFSELVFEEGKWWVEGWFIATRVDDCDL
ncbi:MAG: hypothetical protein EI684_22240 [Candidatus Viridilinea halotolerans]|uniref:Uncharacterized protein n=1 Tax=Candidatus Viridilinea halotolerans TaxID=2491704 RepID=A0A426TQY1_9CHLR|nr:MAG: hypothetical protein EI684_22240 [Candidatus Viridilinea halotolerans]